jgi:acyl-ACP thioesterase
MFEIRRELGRSSVGVDSTLSLDAMADILQDCSIFHVDSMKSQKEYMKRNHIEIFYASRQIDIIRLPVYHENITVKTWIFDCKRPYAYRNTIILDKDEKVCIASFSIGAFVDTHTGKAVLMPKEFVTQILTEQKYPMQYLDRKIALPDIEPKEAEPVVVLKAHMDFNKHVNNAKYITIAQEYMPEGYTCGRMRAEYKIPAKYKDVMIPKIYHMQYTVIVDLCSVDGNSYATVEFAHM